jgi:hypothetical protein
LRRASERLDRLRTVPRPPNTLAELRRDMGRLRFVIDQTREIEAARLAGASSTPNKPATRRSRRGFEVLRSAGTSAVKTQEGVGDLL